MSGEVPRRSDDERLVAVGRALAASLLGGPDAPLPGAGSRLGRESSSFIPPPSGVEAGSELMAPPRRRRRATLGVEEPSPLEVAAAVEIEDTDLGSLLSAPTPLVVTPPPLSFEAVLVDPVGSAVPEAPVAPRRDDAAPVAPRRDDAAPVAPRRDDAAPVAAPEPPIRPQEDARLPVVASALDIVPLGAATNGATQRPTPEMRNAPAPDPTPSAPDVEAAVPGTDGFVSTLYESLPWAPDDAEDVGARRWRRRDRGDGERPVLPRPDEATVRLPDRREVANDLASSGEALLRAWRGPLPGVDASEEPDEAVDPDRSRAPRRSRSGLLEWAIVIGLAFAVALLLRFYVIESFAIPSESMVSTLLVGDRVAVNKLAYEIGGDVERFDVIVFRRDESMPINDPSSPEFLIKRVIGLPGETIEARGGLVYIDGEPLDESEHLEADVVTNNLSQPVEVPSGEYFVMGDNRERSGDSRVFGTVGRDRVVGRAMAVWWPLDRAGSL